MLRTLLRTDNGVGPEGFEIRTFRKHILNETKTRIELDFGTACNSNSTDKL